MSNPAETRPKPKSVLDQEAKTRRREADAQIVLGLQHILGEGESLLGFSRGKISGSIRGKLNLGPEAFFAPMVNVGLTERRVILQHIHSESGKPGDLAPHLFPLANILGLTFTEIETYGEEPACRLVFRIGADQQVRVRISGVGNVANAKSLTEVFRSLTRTQRQWNSPLQKVCGACGHILDQPFKFCPYCGDRREEDARQNETDLTEDSPPSSDTTNFTEVASSVSKDEPSYESRTEVRDAGAAPEQITTAEATAETEVAPISPLEVDAEFGSSHASQEQQGFEQPASAVGASTNTEEWEHAAAVVEKPSGAGEYDLAEPPHQTFSEPADKGSGTEFTISANSPGSDSSSTVSEPQLHAQETADGVVPDSGPGEQFADRTITETVYGYVTGNAGLVDDGSIPESSTIEQEQPLPPPFREFFQATITAEEQAALDALASSTRSRIDGVDADKQEDYDAETGVQNEEHAPHDFANDTHLLSFATYIPSNEIEPSNESVFKGLMDTGTVLEGDSEMAEVESVNGDTAEPPGNRIATEDGVPDSLHAKMKESAPETALEIENIPLCAEIDAVIDVEIDAEFVTEVASYNPVSWSAFHDGRSDKEVRRSLETDAPVESSNSTNEPVVSGEIRTSPFGVGVAEFAEDSRLLADEARIAEAVIGHAVEPDDRSTDADTESRTDLTKVDVLEFVPAGHGAASETESDAATVSDSPAVAAQKAGGLTQDQHDAVLRSELGGYTAAEVTLEGETSKATDTAAGSDVEILTEPTAEPSKGELAEFELRNEQLDRDEAKMDVTEVIEESQAVAAPIELPPPGVPTYTPPEPLFITDGPMRVHVFINRRPVVLNETFTGANATEVVGKIKARIVPSLPWAQRLLVSNMTGLRFAQEIVKRYNEQVGGHLPPPQSCFEFLNTGQVLGFVNIEMK